MDCGVEWAERVRAGRGVRVREVLAGAGSVVSLMAWEGRLDGWADGRTDRRTDDISANHACMHTGHDTRYTIHKQPTDYYYYSNYYYNYN